MPVPAVRRALRAGFIEARLHTDHATLGDRWQELERGYIGYLAQATYVVIDPGTRELVRWTEYKTEFQDDPATFAAWLEGR